MNAIRINLTPRDHERLRDRLRPGPDGCVFYEGSSDGSGRPLFRVAGRRVGVARVAWTCEQGRELSGFTRLERSCPHEGCVAPEHHMDVQTAVRSPGNRPRITLVPPPRAPQRNDVSPGVPSDVGERVPPDVQLVRHVAASLDAIRRELASQRAQRGSAAEGARRHHATLEETWHALVDVRRDLADGLVEVRRGQFEVLDELRDIRQRLDELEYSGLERHEPSGTGSTGATASDDTEPAVAEEPGLVALFSEVVGDPADAGDDAEEMLRLVLRMFVDEAVRPGEAAEAFSAALVSYRDSCVRQGRDPVVRCFMEEVALRPAASRCARATVKLT